ncbi:polysaccharide deacetylase family protein [Longispora sp. K20-0274]|uniref:polysaccharide deacetylase family protein n=1 Tax=Longispora sp. K20-0274 TaxID=3088255 RepID=UPI00399AF463
MFGTGLVRGWLLAAATLLGVASTAVAIVGPLAPPAEAATGTSVSLTFDDGQASQYATLPLLSSRGMKGTYYINSALVGSSDYYMTWAQIHDIAGGGNEIGGHTLHHTDLTSVSSTTAHTEACDDRSNLIGQGFTPVASFAYPYAAVDGTAEQVIRDCGYSSGRGVGGVVSGNVCNGCPYAESIPPVDPYWLQTPEPAVSSTTLSQLQGYVTNAETHGGGWIVLVFHGICSNSCTGSNSLNPATFTSFLDWLQPRAANGTVVRTVGEVVTGTPPPPPGPDTTPPVTTASCDGAACTGWLRTSPVQVALSATDAGGSGFAATVYTVDGTDPTVSSSALAYTAPFPVTRTTTVRFSSRDNAGNVEQARSQQVLIDAAAPTVAITAPVDGSTVRRNSTVPVTATSTDTGTGSGAASGVAQVVFSLDGATPLATVTSAPYQFSWKVRANLQGSHVLTATATDTAGNTTSTQVRVNIAR